MKPNKDTEAEMKKKYEAHNEKVKKTIPAENLLVWNIKDGWEPLCQFLDMVSTPNETSTFSPVSFYFVQTKLNVAV